MIEYRSFRNWDPPAVAQLWHECDLGRGAAKQITPDAFEIVNYSQPYFDPQGLILAFDGEQPVGFVHAGFGCNDPRIALDESLGVISVVMVHPGHRRQGIGRELVSRAEQYLQQRGAHEVIAGSAREADPFYFGIYGGSRISGFLQSDPLAEPFCTALGYEPADRYQVCQRRINEGRDPTNYRIVNIRRKTKLDVVDQPNDPTWWWFTHFGKLDSLRFRLVDKKTETPYASVTVVGLDAFFAAWGERGVGLVDVFVDESVRGEGYAQTLLVETLKRLRAERISIAEIHIPEDNQFALNAVGTAGFDPIDVGIVYRKPSGEREVSTP